MITAEIPDIAANLAQIRQQITAASADYRALVTLPVTLVAVSKRQTLEAWIEAALAAGQRVFGENRVQEAATR